MENQYLTAKEVAEFIGYNAGTLANWRSAGLKDLPYYKINNAVRYDIQDVKLWMKSKLASYRTQDTPILDR